MSETTVRRNLEQARDMLVERLGPGEDADMTVTSAVEVLRASGKWVSVRRMDRELMNPEPRSIIWGGARIVIEDGAFVVEGQFEVIEGYGGGYTARVRAAGSRRWEEEHGTMAYVVGWLCGEGRNRA